jgi:ABC-type lipopolysaccharide export system ATPase subunit
MAGQPTDFQASQDGPLLAVSGVSKSYRRRLVLREVSLQVCPGEVVAVTGENGAGKTTLLRICAGLEAPDEGTVRCDAAVGYCPQEPALLDLLTAGEHVTLFAAGRRDAAAAGRELLASLGMPAGLRMLARDLSGGPGRSSAWPSPCSASPGCCCSMSLTRASTTVPTWTSGITPTPGGLAARPS